MNESRVTSVYRNTGAAVKQACEEANRDNVLIQSFQVVEDRSGFRCYYIVYIPDSPIFLEPLMSVSSENALESIDVNL